MKFMVYRETDDMEMTLVPWDALSASEQEKGPQQVEHESWSGNKYWRVQWSRRALFSAFDPCYKKWAKHTGIKLKGGEWTVIDITFTDLTGRIEPHEGAEGWVHVSP